MSTPVSLPMGSTQKASVSLTFGVISVNVSVVSAVAEDKEASLKLVCTAPHGVTEVSSGSGGFVPMQRATKCPQCDSADFLGRAKPVADGLVVVPADVLEKAEAADKAFGAGIDLAVHPAEQVEELTRATGSRYYLNVKTGSSDNYALIRELVRSRPDKAFMARFSLKGAAVPYRLMLDGDTLMLVQMADPANVRARPAVSGTVNEAFLDLASTLVDQLTSDYVPANYERPKTRVIAEYVEGKVPSTFALDGVPTGNVTDLFEALRASVAASSPAPAKTTKKTTRKTPAKTARKAS